MKLEEQGPHLHYMCRDAVPVFYAQKEGESHDKIFRPGYPPSQFGAHDDERPWFPASRRWDKLQQLPLQARGCRLPILPALSPQILPDSHLPLYREKHGGAHSGGNYVQKKTPELLENETLDGAFRITANWTTIMKKLYGIKSPVSQHPKKPLLSCCGSSPTSKMRCRTRTASVRLWIFGRTRTAVRSLLCGQSIWTGSSSD